MWKAFTLVKAVFNPGFPNHNDWQQIKEKIKMKKKIKK